MPPPPSDEITTEEPLKVLIAGAGVGGLALANVLSKVPHIDVTLLEQTSQFKRFGGPIQLASNALQIIKGESTYSTKSSPLDSLGKQLTAFK